jgi:hypothetical protein
MSLPEQAFCLLVFELSVNGTHCVFLCVLPLLHDSYMLLCVAVSFYFCIVFQTISILLFGFDMGSCIA